MGRRDDLTGQRFGRLVVLGEAEPGEYVYKGGKPTMVSYVRCLCDCGVEKIIRRAGVVSGNTSSCGCFEVENRDGIVNNFIENKIWNHENTAAFHERDTVVKGTKITTLRLDRINKNNKSGIRGVSWDKSRHKWKANIQIKGKNINLGRFENKQDAINARKEAEQKYFQPILDKYDKGLQKEETN